MGGWEGGGEAEGKVSQHTNIRWCWVRGRGGGSPQARLHSAQQHTHTR